GKAVWARQFRERYPLDPDTPGGAPEVLRTGRSQLWPVIDEARYTAAARDPEHLRLLQQLSPVSVMLVPLEARGSTFGAISFVSAESGRHYDQDDLALAEEVANRAALAIDNAVLYDAQVAVATTLQQSLLPRRLPIVEGLEIAAMYESGGGQSE